MGFEGQSLHLYKKTIIMKKLILTIVAICSLQFANAQESSNIILKVNIDGITEFKGSLIISLFNSEETYLNKPLERKIIDLEGSNLNEFIFRNLIKGEYAITAIHDKNKNGKLDMGMMGPTEGLGYSNNARGMFGPADYEDVKMIVNENMITSISIK